MKAGAYWLLRRAVGIAALGALLIAFTWGLAALIGKSFGWAMATLGYTVAGFVIFAVLVGMVAWGFDSEKGGSS